MENRAGEEAAAERSRISAPGRDAELRDQMQKFMSLKYEHQGPGQAAGAVENLTGMDGGARASSPESRH